MVEFLNAIDNPAPFDQAALARLMVEWVMAQTPDLPENVSSEFHAAAANLLFDAAHSGENND